MYISIVDPMGTYELNMRSPYERAILLESLLIFASSTSMEIKSIEYRTEYGPVEIIILKKVLEKRRTLTVLEKNEQILLQQVAMLNKLEVSKIVEVVKV